MGRRPHSRLLHLDHAESQVEVETRAELIAVLLSLVELDFGRFSQVAITWAASAAF